MWNFEHRGSFVLRRAEASVGEWLAKKAPFHWALRAADPIDASLIACTSSLFSCLSSPGGGTGLFIWIVTVRNGFGEMLVSCWFSLLPYSFRAHNHSYMKLRTTDIPLKICAPKYSYGLPLPGECMCHLVTAIQNDISSKRLPRSTHAMFVYTWITHHSSCLFTTSMTTAPTTEPNTGV